MKARLLLIISVLCLSSLAWAETWNKDYKVGSAPQLRVRVDDASVEVRASSDGAISAHVYTEGYKIGPGEVTITEHQAGDEVSLMVKSPHYKINFGMRRNIKVQVSVPAGAKVNVESSDGSLHAYSLRGPAELRTSDGSIDVQGFDGTLRAHTGDGSIRVDGRFDQLDLDTSDGSVHASVQRGSRMASDWRLRTGDGSVHVELPNEFSANLDISTGDGSIRANGLNISDSSKNEHSFRGKMNSGGPRLEVHTGDGSVTLSKL